MKKDGSPSHHPLSKNETATTTTTTTKDTDTDFSAAEIKPAVAGVFHAQDKQQEQKQTEYIEDSQGIHAVQYNNHLCICRKLFQQ